MRITMANPSISGGIARPHAADAAARFRACRGVPVGRRPEALPGGAAR